ncbi:LPS export ABC transporter periplasmic protein LptC [Sphingobacteriales bacterium UPWRP_1]|nr:LPS export ABC transporter periplasmic protein LptC [Sphingobacteriales bacterium TSM_CSS]PSJ77241.1 LPS export ABC transporter periplasmic protein LptC [Sphingobacteriales bacterium UPWRP_1]
MIKTAAIPITLVWLAFAINSCENSLSEVNDINKKFETTVETIHNVNLLYSDAAHVRVQLEAPILYRYKTDDPYLEFPDGLTVTFYNDSLQVSSSLTARYGIRYERKQETVVRNNVVWNNAVKNEKLETEELIWNEKTKKITSDKFVKVTTDTESIFANGFEAEQDFSRYKLRKITGTVKLPKQASITPKPANSQ